MLDGFEIERDWEERKKEIMGLIFIIEGGLMIRLLVIGFGFFLFDFCSLFYCCNELNELFIGIVFLKFNIIIFIGCLFVFVRIFIIVVGVLKNVLWWNMIDYMSEMLNKSMKVEMDFRCVKSLFIMKILFLGGLGGLGGLVELGGFGEF